MNPAPPIPFVWNGEAMVPARGYLARAQHAYGEGEVVTLAPWESASENSRRHQFAWLREAWQNLPEHLADEFPTEEHLRKWALIRAGFYDEQIIDAGSAEAAERVAQGVRRFPGEAFSAIAIRGDYVVIRRAKSQARGKMNAADFQQAKTKVLEIVSALLGVEPDQLQRANAA